MKRVELVIIGGGSAGMAAACGAYEEGIRDILILERDQELGGILLQCIHNGFGLHYFKKGLSGPEYAERWERKIEEYGIAYKLNAMVLDISPEKVITYAAENEGYQQIKAGAIVLAMGCRERTRGAIHLPGFRPAGVWTAGTAQRYLNMEGYLVGKKVFILGSGDIGLIMARRMTLEGAEVLGVAEIMPYSNGLARNIQQCLRDFDIPLYLSHTVTNILGKDRVEEIEISKVDEQRKAIAGTEKRFQCDTLLLSVGLIPENVLGERAGVVLTPQTKGAVVDNQNQTSVEGIFACGNGLHVHDVVDYVSQEGLQTGKYAAHFLQGKCGQKQYACTIAGNGISYVLPQKVEIQPKETVTLSFRPKTPLENAEIQIKADGKLIKSSRKRKLLPSEMERIRLTPEELSAMQAELSLEITLG